MTVRREQLHEQDLMAISVDLASITGTTTFQIFKAFNRSFAIDSIRYINPTGLTVDTTNYYTLQFKNGSVLVAGKNAAADPLSTHDDAIGAAVWIDFVLSTVAGATTMAPDDALTLVATKAGTQTLPAGRLVVTGRYI